MTDTSDMQALVMAVGEMRGQTRELVHATNNNTQALNHVHTSLAKLEALPVALAELQNRVATLEMSETKRSTIIGLGNWFLTLVPISALITAIGALFAFLRRH